MAPETPPKKRASRDLALRRLTVREYSSAELLGYLRRKGVADDEARTVVHEFEEQGLIDADRYAAAIARSQIARGRGPMAVLEKLKRRGLPADAKTARKLYESQSLSPEADAIRSVLSVRFSNADLSDRKVAARVYRALLRRGFTPSAVRSTLDLID